MEELSEYYYKYCRLYDAVKQILSHGIDLTSDQEGQYDFIMDELWADMSEAERWYLTTHYGGDLDLPCHWCHKPHQD